MNYELKYKELQSFLDSSEVDNIDADYFAKCIILMRVSGLSYTEIQRNLGNPSKKQIRNILLQYNPESIDNSSKKQIKYSKYYSELYNILINTNKTQWDCCDNCYIKDHQIYFNNEPLDLWSDVEQSQVLQMIKSELKNV